MSFKQAIRHGKEYRADFRGSKRFDRSCRNHGGCGYCKGNRTFASRKAEAAAIAAVHEYERATHREGVNE